MNAEWQVKTKAPDSTRKFYVLRETGLRYGFTKVGVRVDGRPEFDSDVYNTVDDVTQFSTLEGAVSALSKAKACQSYGLRYEIVMVSRSVTKGVLKSPAKTVRRIVQDGEYLTAVAKYAVGYQGTPMAKLYLASRKDAWGKGDLECAILHETKGKALKHLQDLAVAARFSWENTKLVRVVEERDPEVRTEDVVKDILTPLP